MSADERLRIDGSELPSTGKIVNALWFKNGGLIQGQCGRHRTANAMTAAIALSK
jgi:hypothetical protein